MKFDLENLNPGMYFPFDEDNAEEGGVTLRLANSDIIEEMNKKCTKKKIEYRKGARHEVIEDNESKRTDMLWEYVIVSWDNVVDNDGNPILCSPENRSKLMKESVQFAKFVGDALDKLTEEDGAYLEMLEKN